MWNILDIVIGKIATNKLRLKLGSTKRNPITQLALQIKDAYIAEWNKVGEIGKFILVVLPLTNLFILSGVFSFLLILTLDFFLVRYLINK